MINIVHKDIFDVKADYILHQVNCMGVMGSGLARQVRAHFPSVYDEYKTLCDLYHYTDQLLGYAQIVLAPNGQYICNLFGQFRYGTQRCQTDYVALKSCLNEVKKQTEVTDVIAIPYNLGCGLAGGDWETVYSIIKKTFQNYKKVLICKI